MQVVPSDTKNDLIMDLLSTRKAKDASHIVIALNSGSGELSTFCKTSGIPIFVLGYQNSITFKIFSILCFIRQFHPEVIYFHSFIPSLVGGTISLTPFRKYKTAAVRHHNLNHHLQKNTRAILLDQFISAIVDEIVAVSNSVRRTLLIEGCREKKIKVIENGLDFNRYKFSPRKLEDTISDRRLEILAIGRLDWQKNYPLILEIAKELEKSGKDFMINILGDGNFGELDKWITKTADRT